MSTIPTAAKKTARKDSRIVEIVVYPDGWVSNSYKWRAPGERHAYRRNGSGHWKHIRTDAIDRKRSGGSGPDWVAFSESGGRLASA